MAKTVQIQYNRYQQDGYLGQLSRPNEPHAVRLGKLHVPAGAAVRKPRPGDPVLYDATENQFKIPTDAAEAKKIVGIIGYDVQEISSQLSSIPTGANSDTYLEYEDNDLIRIVELGSAFVLSGEALEYGDRLLWDHVTFKWDKQAAITVAGANVAALVISMNAALANLQSKPAICIARAPVVADTLTEINLGYGRVN